MPLSLVVLKQPQLLKLPQQKQHLKREAAAPKAAPKAFTSDLGEMETRKMTPTRKAIAKAMVNSKTHCSSRNIT